LGHGQTLAIIAISISAITAFTLVASAEEGLIDSLPISLNYFEI